jgi:hypothetical protein
LWGRQPDTPAEEIPSPCCGGEILDRVFGARLRLLQQFLCERKFSGSEPASCAVLLCPTGGEEVGTRRSNSEGGSPRCARRPSTEHACHSDWVEEGISLSHQSIEVWQRLYCIDVVTGIVRNDCEPETQLC